MNENPKKAVVSPLKKTSQNRSLEFQACSLPSVVSEMKAWKNHGSRFLIELKRYQMLHPVTFPRDEC